MQQTANGDSTVGGTVQPVWGAIASGAHLKATSSNIHASALVSPDAPRPQREVFGFAFGNASLADPTYGYPAWSMNLLTTVAYFGLSIDWNGTIIQNGSGWTTWNSSQLTGLVSTAHANHVRVILSINLHDFSSSSTSTMCAALHPRNRATTVAQTVAQVQKMGVDGVNVDYEGTNTTCYYGAVLSDEMTSLVAEIRAALPRAYIAVDTYSGSAGYPGGFFNVPAMAPYSDSFFVMAYDMEYFNYSYAPLHCSSFCLGPTAPISRYFYNDMTSMSQYTAVVPASKVILGVPYYGRKECVAGVTPTTAPPNAAPSGGVAADGYLDASTENGYPPNTNYQMHREVFDTMGMERWDTWTSSVAKCTREMYWDDPTSLGRKYDVVNGMALRGIGIFALQYGGGAPELWQLLPRPNHREPSSSSRRPRPAARARPTSTGFSTPAGRGIGSEALAGAPGTGTRRDFLWVRTRFTSGPTRRASRHPDGRRSPR
jgi:spore germination protein YaaH